MLEIVWCPRWDSNPQTLWRTWSTIRRVYRFTTGALNYSYIKYSYNNLILFILYLLSSAYVTLVTYQLTLYHIWDGKWIFPSVIFSFGRSRFSPTIFSVGQRWKFLPLLFINQWFWNLFLTVNTSHFMVKWLNIPGEYII